MATLRAHEVHFTYPGAREEVVTKWSHTFNAGQITSMTGESGCGKSTRLFLAALLIRPSSGEILLDDERVDNLSDAQRSHIRAHNFGFVFQDSALDTTRTVIDNVVESCLYRGQSARDHEAYARELLATMNVNVPLDRRPGQISGGQAQRIALCRALLGRPRVIFADEPTGNLDAESGQAVMNMLRRAADEGASVIVVTHDPQVAAFSDEHVHIPAPSQIALPGLAEAPRIGGGQ
ncbi:ABC transporter ATP-binding protein [Schaalia sp. Marseille-Q2122]|uniref:ABC transporter ATP-binding protein n=1 Tax=Schaalia sp. Marseille-Q2122 TaxID=2736604 RepID=UPI00158CDA47|nr:ATP-binding cassette domain-containing protein [Schaalia sp. Marseille-Q2122]